MHQRPPHNDSPPPEEPTAFNAAERWKAQFERFGLYLAILVLLSQSTIFQPGLSNFFANNLVFYATLGYLSANIGLMVYDQFLAQYDPEAILEGLARMLEPEEEDKKRGGHRRHEDNEDDAEDDAEYGEYANITGDGVEYDTDPVQRQNGNQPEPNPSETPKQATTKEEEPRK